MTRRNWRAGALAVGLAFLPAAALAQATPYPRIQLPTGPAGLPNLQVRSLEVRDIGFGSAADGAVSVGRIVFSGFSRESDGVRAERVLFENVTAQFANRRIKIPEIRIAEFRVPVELFRALTEGGASGLDWPSLLQQASIGEIVAPTILDADESLKFQLAYKGLTLQQLRNGVLETARLDGMAGGTREDAREKVGLSLGEIQYRKINMTELLRFVTGGGSGGAKLLIGEAVVRGLKVDAADVSMAVDKFEISGLEGRAPETALDDLPGGPRIVVPEREASERERRMARYAQSALQHLRLARYSIEGISFSSADLGRVSLGSIGFAGFDARGFERFEIRDVDVSGAAGAGKLEHFAIEKVVYGSLLNAALEAAANGREPDLSPATFSDLRIGAIRLARLHVDTPAGPISLGAFRIESDDAQAAIPEKLTVAVERLKLDLTRASRHQGRDQLMALGYRELLSDAQVELRSVPNERAFIVDNTRVTVDEVGRADLKLRLENFDLTAATADPSAAERAVGNAQFASVSLALTDLGFAERLFNEIARAAQQRPDAVRAQLATDIRNQAVANFGAALTPGSAEAIAGFIRSGGRILINVTPRGAPLTISALERMSQPEFVRRVTISVAIPQN